MMSWLQKRSPEQGTNFGSCDLSSAAVAASAAADEILKSMFKSSLPTSGSRGKPTVTVSKGSNKSLMTSKTTSDEPSTKEPFLFTGNTDNTKVVPQHAKKPMKKTKFEFQGSTSCSGMMLNWLSGAKSPTQPTHQVKQSPLKASRQIEDSIKKRKAQDSSDIDLTCETTDDYGHSVKSSKKHRGEMTPVKSTSCKDSAINSDKKKPVNMTPRRRSMRLTPIKSTSLQSNITQLETLQESKESIFDQYRANTPKKQPMKCSLQETPSKASYTVSKKTTPSKR